MKPAIDWLNEVGETVASSMFSRSQPPGAEVEALIKRIQDDARTPECPAGDPEQCDYRLRQCPFCGGDATLRRTPDNGVFVDCDQCTASSKLVYADKTNPVPIAVEAWNARAYE